MRLVATLVLACGLPLAASVSTAQPPGGGKGGKKDGARGGASLVERLMAFDKNKDGKLAKDEVTDERLARLFEQADENKDGTLTKDELTAFATKMDGDRGRGGPGGPGGRGGPGMFGPPQPGQILPAFLQDQLNLTADQKKQLAELQKEVDAKLEKLLTAEQKKQLKEMRERGPGGFPGGPPPGGPPPGGPDRS